MELLWKLLRFIDGNRIALAGYIEGRRIVAVVRGVQRGMVEGERLAAAVSVESSGAGLVRLVVLLMGLTLMRINVLVERSRVRDRVWIMVLLLVIVARRWWRWFGNVFVRVVAVVGVV